MPVILSGAKDLLLPTMFTFEKTGDDVNVELRQKP
jgi:hypothetical protein